MPPSAKIALSRTPAVAIAFFAAVALAGCASREEKIQRVQSRAEAALFENNIDLAVQTLSEGLDRFPDSNEIRIALSRALASDGQLEEAAELLQEAILFDPDQDELWVRVGELRAQLGDSQAAIDALESYLENHDDDFLAWKALALEYEKLGNLTEAIKAATRWNELTPSAQPAYTLGKLYLASGNAPQARSWFGQAAAYEGESAAREALAELIQLETSLPQFQQAEIWLNEYQRRYGASASDPRVQEAQAVLENWRQAREDIARAAAELEKERGQLAQNAHQEAQEESNPNSFQPVPEPADTFEVAAGEQDTDEEATGAEPPADAPAVAQDGQPNGKPPEALFGSEPPPETTRQSERSREPAVQISSDGAARQQAIAAVEAQNYDQAIPQLWQLLGSNPQDAELWYQLSRAYYAQQNWFDAEATILEARRRAPQSKPIAQHYLRAIAQTQNQSAVLKEMREIQRSFPKDPDIALTRARVLREIQAAPNHVATAYRDVLEFANRRHPGSKEATQYLQNAN